MQTTIAAPRAGLTHFELPPHEGTIEVVDTVPAPDSATHYKFMAHEAASQAELPYLSLQVDAVRRRHNMSQAQNKITDGLLCGMRQRSQNQCAHCMRVALGTVPVAEFLGADPKVVMDIGLLHDIAKAELPDDVLEATVAGTGIWSVGSRNRTLMAEHPKNGAKAAREAGKSEEVAEGIAYHHSLQTFEPVGDIHDLGPRSRLHVVILRLSDFVDASFRNDCYQTDDGISQQDYAVQELSHAFEEGCGFGSVKAREYAATAIRILVDTRVCSAALIELARKQGLGTAITQK